jgi:pilus assembly protein FimV
VQIIKPQWVINKTQLNQLINKQSMNRLLPAFVVALGGLSCQSFAVGLGEVDLRSYLGQPLDARVPVIAGPDEPLDESCFKLTSGAITSDTGHATPAKISFQQIGRNNVLLIRSSSAVPEPAVRIQVEVSCGNISKISREYTLLLDPPEYAAASRITLPAAPVAAAPVRQIESVAAAQTSFEPLPVMAEQTATTPFPMPAPAPRRAAPRKPSPQASAPRPKAPRVDSPPVAQPAPPIARLEAQKPKTISQPTEPKVAEAPLAAGKKEPALEGFRLKLSSAEIDLGPTKTVSDSDRQRLRERQLLLETQSDDQTASMLAMKNSIKQLETQLAELRNKVSTNSNTGNAATTPQVTTVAAGNITPAVPDPVTAPVTPAPVAIPVAKSGAAKPAVSPESTFSLADWVKPALAASGLGLAAIIGINLWRRRKLNSAGYDDLYASGSPASRVPVQPVGQFDEDKLFEDSAEDDKELQEILSPAEIPSRPRVAPLDLPLSSAPGNADMRNMIDPQAPDSFKLAYLRERFPEIAQGSLRLDKPDSLIHAARLYYQEDNNSAKATELLEYAIGEYPHEVRPWLALFEIYRLENRTADFSSLAQRFKTKFEQGGYWPKVQGIGRQLDAGNPLYAATEYQADEFDPDTATISPEAENWLNTPLDFTQDLLGGELRNALMAEEPSKAAARSSELTLSPEGKKPV